MILYKDWLLVVAVGLTLVAVGHIIDFFLKKKEVRKIHDIFLDWSNALSDTPIRDWQFKVVSAGYRSIHKLHLKAASLMFYMAELYKSWPLTECSFVGDYYPPLFSPDGFISKISKISVFIIATLPLYVYSEFIFFASRYIFPITFVSDFIIYITVIYYTIFFFLLLRVLFSKKELKDTNIIFILASPIISFTWTCTAILLSYIFISEDIINNFLYKDPESEYTSAFLILSFISFPFDFATIYITSKLLKLILNYKKFISIVATIDIFLSFCLAYFLYYILVLYIDSYTPIGYISSDYIFYLIPVSCTMFIPVLLYMSILLFLSFCKPVMWTSSRFFSAIGEKEESVFKQFGILFTVVMAAIKSIYDYISVH
jgi:hypothetical protein